MNINLPNFNVKNLVKEAGSTLSRVVQLTEEKLGTTERTEYDNEFQNLAERADITKTWTEKIVRDTETVLIPNPQNRIEDFIFEKIEKTKPQRLSNLEHLALGMIEAGGDFGQDLPYGQALIKVGQAEQKLGQCERDFIASSGICFTQPLRKFLEGEMKTITKERGILETKRLDLDACKNRVKKARSMLGQQAAERDLRVAQAEFDRQSEITKVLLEGISTSQASHLRHLHAFVETQVRYYKHCMDAMNNLQRDLANLGGPTPYVPIDIYNDNDGSATGGLGLNAGVGIGNAGGGAAAGVAAGSGARRRNPGDPILNADQMRRARVLCAYDAKDHTELNLNANEVIFVTECSPVNPDYMYGKQGLLKGLVPRAFLEMLDNEGNDTYAGNNDY
ncbi:endophilin-B1 isoform X2 [Bactrocera neohumeralis]|uniref:endophilin-B1 isoform X2 n=1 Tax=Bactrocera tryoni TaxID=59916 RepID=UPI001A9625A6|nr:endophilin-B1 isoform X2 [Bactrocera tryoni]XP_050327241.1 endophilin-B1 isoform X2 [Bactrocera neohumeralis]